MIKLRQFTIIASLLVLLFSSSCEYQKLLKSSDYEKKLEQAQLYYEAEDYSKALTLFEQINPIYKGSEKGEDVLYSLAECNYKLKDYIISGYYYRLFANSYPNSERSEEAMFMSAYCYYLDVPKTMSFRYLLVGIR